MKGKTIGIIGGMGPESTSDFYLDLTRMAQEKCSSRPSIVIHSLPIKFSIEEGFIKNGTGKDEYFDWLIEGVKILEKAEADFIVIPCNTVHIFMDELRKITKIPIVSITEETAKLCSKKNFKKVGILATTLVIRDKLYEKEFKKLGIEVVNVSKEDQKFVSDAIHKIVTLQATEKEKMILEKLAGNLKNQGAEAIVLGCTDLEILIKGDHGIEIIDSMDTLAKSAFEKLLLDENQGNNMSKFEEVKQFIKKNSIQAEIIQHEKSGLTSEGASKATGVKLEEIIKTLLFVGKNKDLAIVICQGNKLVDPKKLSEISGLKKPRLATAKELEEFLSAEPGGTPPICLPENIPKFIDRDVLEQEFVVGSAGNEFTGLRLRPSDIVKFTNAKVVDITKG